MPPRSTHWPMPRMRSLPSATGMNCPRRHQAALGVLPAHQAFGPEHIAALPCTVAGSAAPLVAGQHLAQVGLELRAH